MIEGLTRREISNYQIESDKAFRKFAKKIANEYHVYFELVNDGVYKLIPKRNVI